MFEWFDLIYLKSFCVSSKHSEGMQPTIQHSVPFIYFQIIGYNFNTIPVPKEKELSCRQSFSSELVQNITILHIFHQNFSGEDNQTPPLLGLLPYSTKA